MNKLTIRYICLVLLSLVFGKAWSQISVVTEDVSCYGEKDGAINIFVPNATEMVTYNWSEYGYGENFRTGLDVGHYQVTITDETKCDHVVDAYVGGPSAPLKVKITFGRDENGPCDHFSPVIVSITPSGGTPPYKMNGKSSNGTGSFTDVVNFTQFRSYTVVDDHGCYVRKNMRVFVGYNHCADDPNDIIGPSGYEAPAWIAGTDTLSYTINFENNPQLATAPAQHVFITQEFDDEINPNTFRLGTFGFGEHTFTVPDNVAIFQRRYDITQTHDVFLDVVAGLDVQNNRAFWSLVAIDPLTGLRPISPFVGFLPVNDSLSSGQGFVTFLVKLKSTVMTGDTIQAQASIVFDQNAAISTNIWTNTVDALPPVTALDPLDPIIEDNVINLSWTGSDDPGGCGIAYYELYVSKDGGPFEAFSLLPADTLHSVFIGEYGHTYDFYVVGTDYVGNVEVKTALETSSFILPSWKVRLETPLNDVYCLGDSIVLDYSTVLADAVHILMTTDTGLSFQTIASAVDTAENPFSWIVPDSLADSYIKFFVIASDSSSIMDSSGLVQIKSPPNVDAGQDISTCPQDLIHLIPSGANTFFWEPRVGLNEQTDAFQSFRPDTSSTYYVTGTDVSGCINSDSIVISVYPSYLDSVAHVMCNEDSVFVGGAYQTEEGYYTDELISIYGCDSTVVTHVILTGPCPFAAPQAYVDKDAIGLNNGTSWANAFTDLQDALEAVSYYENVREIWIAEGDYYPSISDRDSAFVLTDSVLIYGGFIGIENAREERSADPSLVQISGDIGVLNDSTDNAYHVFRVDTSCVDCALDGVTVQFGQADLPFNQAFIGAGIYTQGTLLLDNCIVERNISLQEGAAIYNDGIHAVMTIRNCTFRLNNSGLARDILNGSGAEIHFEGLNTVED